VAFFLNLQTAKYIFLIKSEKCSSCLLFQFPGMLTGRVIKIIAAAAAVHFKKVIIFSDNFYKCAGALWRIIKAGLFYARGALSRLLLHTLALETTLLSSKTHTGVLFTKE